MPADQPWCAGDPAEFLVLHPTRREWPERHVALGSRVEVRPRQVEVFLPGRAPTRTEVSSVTVVRPRMADDLTALIGHATSPGDLLVLHAPRGDPGVVLAPSDWQPAAADVWAVLDVPVEHRSGLGHLAQQVRDGNLIAVPSRSNGGPPMSHLTLRLWFGVGGGLLLIIGALLARWAGLWLVFAAELAALVVFTSHRRLQVQALLRDRQPPLPAPQAVLRPRPAAVASWIFLRRARVAVHEREVMLVGADGAYQVLARHGIGSPASLHIARVGQVASREGRPAGGGRSFGPGRPHALVIVDGQERVLAVLPWQEWFDTDRPDHLAEFAAVLGVPVREVPLTTEVERILEERSWWGAISCWSSPFPRPLLPNGSDVELIRLSVVPVIAAIAAQQLHAVVPPCYTAPGRTLVIGLGISELLFGPGLDLAVFTTRLVMSRRIRPRLRGQPSPVVGGRR